ncbi:MAG: translation elongation factor Ts [Chloroflexi bacterium]|nr:translation elongation factor Ts [Chloroflexota bacterium]MCC6892871.1 translation elongation factor Ts [Anaerolineae bacterium]
MAITAQMVKDLRESTGAGPLDCKKALEVNNGDVAKAADWLREKGIAKAAKKMGAGRTMNDGIIGSYIHHDKRMAVIVEVNCETDFVARTEKFQEFARNMAIHIANLTPKYVRREDVPAAEVEAEREIQKNRALNEGKKPEAVIEKIVDGRMDKFFEEIVLLEQPFVKDDSKKISQMLSEAVAELGESIQISRFARFKIGENVSEDGESSE